MFGSGGDLGMGIKFQLIDQSTQTAGRIQEGMAGLTSSVDKLGAKSFMLNQISDAIGNITGVLGQFSSEFVELDAQVKNIGTLGVENFQEFADLATDLSKRVPDSASAIAQGVYQAISAGAKGSNQDILNFTETASKAAVAGMATTEQAVNGLTSVLNAYKMETSEASNVADTFFAGIKLGKTTFQELNMGLAQVVPAASSAKVGFDEVIASIAQMTALGVPTRQATTQIRQAIVELQKPGKALSEAMKAAGLSASTMNETLAQQGLLETLQQIEGGAASMGLTMTQVFGSVEAASAALLLSGDNAQRANETLKGVRDEMAAGAAGAAYEVASKGIGVRLKILFNNVQSWFKGIFDFMGDGAVIAMEMFNKFAPAVTSLALTLPLLKTAFMALRSSALVTTIASKGLATGLMSVGRAALASLAPLLPYIAIGAAIAGAVWLVNKSLSAFDDLLAGGPARSGFMGFLQRIGGVIRGVAAIWTSWNGEVFSLSESMRSALQSAGVLDFALAVGTYVVRVKSFFMGLKQGALTAWAGIKPALEAVWNALSPIGEIWDMITFAISGNNSEITSWADAGQKIASFVGGALKYALEGLAFVLKYVAIGIREVARGYVWFYGKLLEGVRAIYGFATGIGGAFQDFFTVLSQGWDNFIGFFTGLPARMAEIGAGIVNSIREGISGAWDGLVQFLFGLLSDLPLGGQLAELFGLESSQGQLALSGAGRGDLQAGMIGQRIADLGQIQTAAREPKVINSTTERVEQITNIFNVDGEEVYRNVENRARLNDSR